MINSPITRSSEERHRKYLSQRLPEHPVNLAIRTEYPVATMPNQIVFVKRYASSVEGVLRIILIVSWKYMDSYAQFRESKIVLNRTYSNTV